jgi:hypothetical protein
MISRRLLLFAVLILALWFDAGTRASADPIISVGPYTPSTTMPFVVPIEITGAIALQTWQFDLAFNPSDLQVNTSCVPFSVSGDPYCADFPPGPVTEGPFTSSNGTFLTLFIPGVSDNVGGLVSLVAGAYLDIPPGPSGNGTLAFVEFVTTPNGTGTSPITVQNGSTTGGVPEPATLALLVGGLALLGVRRRMNGRRGDEC